MSQLRGYKKTREAKRRTVLPADLVLRDDNLRRVCVFCPWDRVLEDTDRSDHLACLNDPHLASSVDILSGAEVRRVANNLFGAHRLAV